jgi:hypothetical protein
LALIEVPPMQIRGDNVTDRIITSVFNCFWFYAGFDAGPVSVAPIEDLPIQGDDTVNQTARRRRRPWLAAAE